MQIPCGGACPKGRLAEDGPIPNHYPLFEICSSDYHVRTKQNILDSHGTLITSTGPLDGGSKLTYNLCKKLKKPVLHLKEKSDKTESQITQLKEFIDHHFITILNVAGPRASKSPNVYEFTKILLTQFFKKVLEAQDFTLDS